MNEPTTQELLAVFDSLPDLLKRAREAEGGRDVYEVLEELEQEHVASGRGYVRAMPHRSPPKQCSTGEHPVPMVEYRIIAPASGLEAKLWEAELHEAREHGGKLSTVVAGVLRTLTASSS